MLHNRYRFPPPSQWPRALAVTPQRRRRQTVRRPRQGLLLRFGWLLLAGVVLTGCGWWWITADHNVGEDDAPSKLPSVEMNLSSSPVPFRLDEQARLLLHMDNLLELEKQKAYASIYDQYAHPTFRATISRNTFIALGHCAETHLGPLEGYHRPSVLLQRHTTTPQEKPPPQAQPPVATTTQPVDEVTVRVNRQAEPVWERGVFIPVGVDYQLVGYYWSAQYPPFQHCIQQVLQYGPPDLTPPDDSLPQPQ